jgi:hypothetical protein
LDQLIAARDRRNGRGRRRRDVPRRIVSREFGLAAVIGAHEATTRIPHGAHVEVDPEHGTVRLL